MVPGDGRAAGELALVLGLFAVYKLGRAVIAGQEQVALHHAVAVHRLQQMLGLPSEAAIQGAVSSEALFVAANTYYTGVHFPLMAILPAVGMTRRPRARVPLGAQPADRPTGSGPGRPRRSSRSRRRGCSRSGVSSTPWRASALDAYGGASGALANQFAAMPSLHVGWAVLIAYVVRPHRPALARRLAARTLLVTDARRRGHRQPLVARRRRGGAAACWPPTWPLGSPGGGSGPRISRPEMTIRPDPEVRPDRAISCEITGRWRWDFNPRWVSPHNISSVAPSAARTRHRGRGYRSPAAAEKSPRSGA